MFFFRGSALQVFGQSAGRNADSVLPKLFSGDMDFRKTETNLFLHFVRAEEGSGEESAWASFKIFIRSEKLQEIDYSTNFFT